MPVKVLQGQDPGVLWETLEVVLRLQVQILALPYGEGVTLARCVS